MSGLLKRFLSGLFYLAVLPGLLIILAIYAVVGLVMFIVIGVKSVILFFTGRNIFGDLPEDLKAKEILEKMEEEKETPEVVPPTLEAYSGAGFTPSNAPVPPPYGTPVPPGYIPPTYPQPGYGQPIPPSYPQPGYPQPGYGQPVPPGYGQPVPPSYPQPGYGQPTPPGYVPPTPTTPVENPPSGSEEDPIDLSKNGGDE